MSLSFSEEVNFIVALFYEVYKSYFLVVVSTPVADEAVNTVVAADVVFLAAFARHDVFDGSIEKRLLYLYLVGTRVGDYAFEAVHLPHVP